MGKRKLEEIGEDSKKSRIILSSAYPKDFFFFFF